MSPPQSISSHALTVGAQQRMNVVTRLAIEGKAKKNEKGAGVRMYLKVRRSFVVRQRKAELSTDVSTNGQPGSGIHNCALLR